MTPVTLPETFLWGVATSGHQTEGDNSASDTWFLERTTPSLFREPSGPACRSHRLWETDLDLAAGLGLNAFRFSVEWARVEPERAVVSAEALDHYERVVDGCLERGLAPLVTFSHFTAPHWFAAAGSWTAADAPALFAEQCDRVMARFGDRIAYGVTLNEPNLEQLLQAGAKLPAEAEHLKAQMLAAAARAAGSDTYTSANVIPGDRLEEFQAAFTLAHRAARDGPWSPRRDQGPSR
jgi:beta-glucosidase